MDICGGSQKLSVTQSRFLDLFLHPSEGGSVKPHDHRVSNKLNAVNSGVIRIAVAPPVSYVYQLHLELLCIMEE